LIPDRIWGLNIREACNIHDWMWRVDRAGFSYGNRVFLDNMNHLINNGLQWKWLVKCRRHRANVYYKFVSSKAGEKYYNKMKELTATATFKLEEESK